MTDITITDADYQALERDLVNDALHWRRECAVYKRRVRELMHEVATLRAALATSQAEAVP